MASAERAIESAVVKLGHLLVSEIKFLSEVHGDVYWMQSELRWMSCFLADADAKRKNGDKRTKNWIREVTNIAQEAEDVVDTFMLQIERDRRQNGGLFKRHSCIPKLVDLHYIGTAILQIRSKIHSISESKDRYGISNLCESSGSTVERVRAQRNINPRLIGNKFIIGFESKKDLILERLLNPKVKKRGVVSIVGMGGLGKTTLATIIYNSDEVKDWFPYHAWVAVSEEFKPLELLHNIIKQVGGNSEKYNNMNTGELISELHDCLKNQRYLIVLDDIWEHNPDVWQQLKDAFPDVENGSRVLITTRFIGVGRSVDPSNEPYVLPFLGNEESWELFLNVGFPSEDGSTAKCPKLLEKLGKDLVKKCGGLPLGVKMLGGLLSVTDPTIKAWKEVALKWKYQDKSLDYLQILALSYNKLPNVNMKSCFLYIGNYPEDYVIKASELTKFWIAEGFVPEEENQTFEDTAKGYLDEFVLRCMIQVVDRTKTSKRVKCFRIHDLFRSWCILEAQEDGFFRICTSSIDTSGPKIVAARRLTVYKSTLNDKFHDLSYNARAILGFDYLSAGNFLLRNIGQNFKHLRVIYLSFPDNVEIHKSNVLKEISRLIHLRNMTLISKALTYLPSSIGKLHNLQTLNIKNTSIMKLPTSLFKIRSLRHLYTRGITIRSPVNWKSINLQTLDSVSAGSRMLKDFTQLLNLRKLSISGITQIEAKGLQDSLHRLVHLKSLCLKSDGQSDPSLFTSFKSHNPLSKLVLINWSNISSEFPQNLISIILSGCTFEKGVIASLEKLPSLANLNLEDCGIHSEDELVCSANGFHQLENLHIGEMRSLLDWKIENGALPKIKYLMIRASNWLQMLPNGLEHLKSLQKLEMIKFKEELKRRLVETLEDRHKIPQITYVTLNGIQLDQHNRSSGIMHPSEMSVSDDLPIAVGREVSLSGRSSDIRGRTQVTVVERKVASVGESKYKMMLDVKGINPEDGLRDRSGVDFVIVLDVGLSNSGILKSTMESFMEKLNFIDRLSVIVSSKKPVQLCPLQQHKDGPLPRTKNWSTDSSCGHGRNITAGIQMGLKVLSDRRFTTGRMAAILLMSDAMLNTYDYNITQVQLGNIPVYTFGLGEDCHPRVLKELSNRSMGGTFSYIRKPIDFSIAFSKCFATLFTLAVSDLKLTVKQINSTIQSIYVGNYPQSTDAVDGSVTVSFGDLYVKELHRIIVDLRLPAVERGRWDEILQVTSTYTYSSPDEVVHSPISIEIRRGTGSVVPDPILFNIRRNRLQSCHQP